MRRPWRRWKPRARTHPSLPMAADALRDGRCLYAALSSCSGPAVPVGLRHREDDSVVLACKAHVGRLRQLRSLELDQLERGLRREFGHAAGDTVTIYRLCNACGGKYENPGRSTGKCPSCQTAYEREKSRRRRATSGAVRTRNSAAWQQARELAKRRDAGCVLRHQGGCAGRLQVHHRVPLERGGSNSLDNLITVCRAHHEQLEAA